MKFTLYIQQDCLLCTQLVNYIYGHDIGCEVKDIADEAPPVAAKFGVVPPALFYARTFVAGGKEDILHYLKFLRS